MFGLVLPMVVGSAMGAGIVMATTAVLELCERKVRFEVGTQHSSNSRRMACVPCQIAVHPPSIHPSVAPGLLGFPAPPSTSLFLGCSGLETEKKDGRGGGETGGEGGGLGGSVPTPKTPPPPPEQRAELRRALCSPVCHSLLMGMV